MIYNVRHKIFPDGTIQYLYCNKAKEVDFKKAIIDLPDAYLENNDDNDLERDINYECNKRAKQKVWDIARANNWDYFFTLTLDPKLVDRFNYSDCVDLIKSFTQSLRYYECNYIIVPEKHKNGAWHFHGLLQGNPPVILAKTLNDGTELYNFSNYKFGFTSLSKVKSQASVCTYLTKYITKELIVPSGRKRYWCSRNLKKPIIEYHEINREQLNKLLNKTNFHKYIETPYGNYDLIEICGDNEC